MFFQNLDYPYFCQHHDWFYFFCQHLDHLHFSQIADPAAAYHYGITTLPSLVYFKNSVPNLFDGETSISHKRGKSNIVSARQICISPEENLEWLKRIFSKSGWNTGGCRQHVVLSGRLTAAPPARCERVNTPINRDKVWQITPVMASQGCFCFTTSHKHAP